MSMSREEAIRLIDNMTLEQLKNNVWSYLCDLALIDPEDGGDNPWK